MQGRRDNVHVPDMELIDELLAFAPGLGPQEALDVMAAELTDREFDELMQELGLGGPLEESDDGRLIWRESADPAYTWSTTDYEEVTRNLERERTYMLYVRTIYGDDSMEASPGSGYVEGSYRGSDVGRYWRPHKLGNSVWTAGKKITPGRLEELAKYLRQNEARGYVKGWYLSLVARGAGGVDWLAMRDDPVENCATAVLREALKAGKNLTPARAKVLDRFEARVAVDGATVPDLAWLCTQLKMRIEVRGLQGELLWGPTNAQGDPSYSNRKPLTIYRSNGHAFHKLALMPPVVGEKAYFCGEYQQRWKTEAVSPLDAERRMFGQLAAVINEEKLLRAYVVGSEIVGDDGIVRRDSGLAEELRELEGRPRDAQGKPVPVLHIGGLQSLRFKRWRRQQGISSLPRATKYRAAWRSANVEAVPWCVGGAEELKAGVSYDMRKAYLACDERPDMARGPGQDWALKHGFPGEVQRSAAVSTLEEVEGLAGCVRFLELRLAESCPEALRSILANHVEGEKEPWLPVPLALFLRDKGLLASYRLEQLVYSAGRLEGLSFPDRDNAVRFIGSCKYSAARQTLWTRDKAEAEFYQDRYAERSVDICAAGGGYFISWDSADSRTDHSHIRAYVLAYMFIGMAEAILQIPKGALLACKVDSLTLAEGYELPTGIPQSHGVDKQLVPAGVFLRKAAGLQVKTYHRVLREEYAPDPYAPAQKLSTDPLARRSLTFLDGQGGAGKTWRALRAFPGRKVVVLGKDNEHCLDLRSETKNPDGHSVKTYHEFLHLGAGDPKAWDRAVMGRTKPDVVIWDEIGSVPAVLLDAALAWMQSIRAIVVLCGDPLGQLHPWKSDGMFVVDAIERAGAVTEFMEKDHRAARCPRLQGLKLKMWRQSEAQQIAALQEVKQWTAEEFLKQWTPNDLVAVVSNPVGQAVEVLLEAERRARYPTEPVRLRFKPTPEKRKLYQKKGGKLKDVKTPDGRLTPAIVGSRITVPAGTAYDPDLWTWDAWSTLHSLQGRTIEAPGRLVVVEDGLGSYWVRNGAYTAVSRVEEQGQLYRVALKAGASPYEELCEDEEYD